MRHFILIIFAAILLSGCEDTQTNSPALQTELDNIFFKAIDARAIENEDGSFNILGVTQDETLTLHINKAQLGIYPLGAGQPNYATFEDANGNIYSSNPEGSGEIILTDRCISCGLLTGTFKFTSVLAGIDTIVAQKGLFFEVKFPVASDDNEPTNAGTFVAQINGTPFNAFTVAAANTGNNIIITGSTSSTTILLRMPIEITSGTHILPMAGFQATLTNGAGTQTAQAGTFIIVEHNVASKTIKGTFSFDTGTTIVSLGQFNVSYL
ncbi:hypothetical protein ATE92_0773 [Ulvibacter sp. MAR_2010_11]|uniref:DUF6252 family protein n=1 Tax=Ulvibacter sp. MAR_2010_11 TaxID=1250229 RepID=UPI000C2B7C90|nr:DUF6252 family protein [Ulvibacter sp. MAR_2010_11]PKA82637.1 hypothetical protein ATE92_0773 [Ulvibacter sp. MAR_2010_11]